MNLAHINDLIYNEISEIVKEVSHEQRSGKTPRTELPG